MVLKMKTLRWSVLMLFVVSSSLLVNSFDSSILLRSSVQDVVADRSRNFYETDVRGDSSARGGNIIDLICDIAECIMDFICKKIKIYGPFVHSSSIDFG